MVYSTHIYVELWHNKVHDFLFKIKLISVNTCFDNRRVNEVVVTCFANWQFNVLPLARKYPFSSLSFVVINMSKFLTWQLHKPSIHTCIVSCCACYIQLLKESKNWKFRLQFKFYYNNRTEQPYLQVQWMSPRGERNSSFLTSRALSYEEFVKIFENELNNNKTVSFLLAFSFFPPPFLCKGGNYM